MHENRESSCTSWPTGQDRSAKAINRTADVNVQEQADCAVVPMNQPNKEGQPSAEVGEGRAQTEENIVQSHMRPTQSGSACPRDCTVCGQQHVSPPFIHSKSRMRKSARTDMRGGRSAMVVPTATVIGSSVGLVSINAHLVSP